MFYDFFKNCFNYYLPIFQLNKDFKNMTSFQNGNFNLLKIVSGLYEFVFFVLYPYNL